MSSIAGREIDLMQTECPVFYGWNTSQIFWDL